MKAFSLTFSAATLLVLTAVPVMAQQTTGVLGDPNRKFGDIFDHRILRLL
jgi:hypothetical protein